MNCFADDCALKTPKLAFHVGELFGELERAGSEVRPFSGSGKRLLHTRGVKLGGSSLRVPYPK